ncbi:nibrin-like isoform X1 [Vespa mandarinia]|uniref:nibrin-like isoform X1 n=2 Tax=Vespa mandarinia TaxID=7446 RepID=UPI00160EE674|nr:nibrin-like isoform X1 [Vespa mandarinia]
MWLLTSPTGKLIYFKPNIPVSIGRKKCDIILSHDTSISKFHASIVVIPQTKYMMDDPTALCILKDEGSKYGTFIFENDTFKKVITDVNLKDKDIIRIGLQEEIFKVTYIPIVTLTSGLQGSEKGKLHEILGYIDGVIAAHWEKFCTHLTVLKPKLTEKVAVSLAAGLPIVTMDYWKAVKSAVEESNPLPKTDNYISEISEQYISKGIVSLRPNDKRKTLFRNLIFNFFYFKQYEMYKPMITLAGGKSVLFNYKKNKQTVKLQNNFIFVQLSYSDETQLKEDVTQEYDNICNTLKSLKQRIIPESEISLAILYCSIERYCNTKYNFASIFKRQEKVNYNLPETLVIDTQDQELLTKDDSAMEKRSCHRKDKNYVVETLQIGDSVNRQSDVASQKMLDNEKELTTHMRPTTSKNRFSPEIIESEESDSSDIVVIKQVKVVKNKSTDMQGTSKTKETQKAKVKENLATINFSNIKCSENKDIKQNSNTSSILIRKHPPGKTFQKAHVKIPIKRMRL